MSTRNQRLADLEATIGAEDRLDGAARAIATRLAAGLTAMDEACGLPTRDYSGDVERFMVRARRTLRDSLDGLHGPEARRDAQRRTTSSGLSADV